MATNTIRLHRVLRTPPDRLYRAFTEPAAFERWLPPFGFTGKVHSMEPVVGGAWRMSFTNFGTGQSHSFGGKYLELVPGERIAYDAAFDDPNLPGEMQVTVTLKKVLCGTELNIEQAGIPDAELVAKARNGKEALTFIRELKPDIAVLDIQMPVKDGFAAIAELKPGEHLPEIIFVTAYQEHAVRAFEVHAVDYLLKPVSFERFREAVRLARARLDARAAAVRHHASVPGGRHYRCRGAKRGRSCGVRSATTTPRGVPDHRAS